VINFKPGSREIKTCTCRKKKQIPKSDGVIRVARSTKGRKGKGVSVITGIPLKEHELKALAKSLKQKCGTGGTVKNGIIVIQGDHRNLLVDELKKAGYTAKLSGG